MTEEALEHLGQSERSANKKLKNARDEPPVKSEAAGQADQGGTRARLLALKRYVKRPTHAHASALTEAELCRESGQLFGVAVSSSREARFADGCAGLASGEPLRMRLVRVRGGNAKQRRARRWTQRGMQEQRRRRRQSRRQMQEER